MPLVEDVLIQQGKSQWFFVLDLQLGFWVIEMVVQNIQKFVLITKSRLFDWIIMPFGMKNAISMFSRTMMEIFGAYMDKFLMVFIDYLNVYSLSCGEHFEHLRYVFMRFK